MVGSRFEESAGLLMRVTQLGGSLESVRSEGKCLVVRSDGIPFILLEGLIVRVGIVGHPYRVKSFRKVSAVMYDLEMCHLIIDNLH